MSQTQWREPIEFAAGDTLAFSKKGGDYKASDGWSLKYELRGDSQVIEFTSTANTNGTDHDLNVTSAATSNWLPGDYQLAGYAVNGNERHQIYLGQLTITQDLVAASGDADTQTFAQKMIEQIETVMLAKAKGDLLESWVGETRFKYMTFDELNKARAMYIQERRQEVAKERAKAGLPTGNKIRPLFNINTSSGGVSQRRFGYGGW